MRFGEFRKGRKNLIFATLISIPGPLLLAIGLNDGSSATGIADLIRRSCEFLTIFLAWLVYELTAGRGLANNARKTRLEGFVKYFTGLSMCLSGAVMIYVAVANFGGEKGSVLTSLILAVIGAVINAKLYFNYRTMENAVLSVQAKLHRVKMLLDCFVLRLVSKKAWKSYCDMSTTIIALSDNREIGSVPLMNGWCGAFFKYDSLFIQWLLT